MNEEIPADYLVAFRKAFTVVWRKCFETICYWSLKKLFLFIVLATGVFGCLLLVRETNFGGLAGIAMATGVLLAQKLKNIPMFHEKKNSTSQP